MNPRIASPGEYAIPSPQSRSIVSSKAAERPRLCVLAGLPGSGKSTWLEQNEKYSLSSDTLRILLTGSESNQNHNGLVFSQLRGLVRARLAARCEETWIDSTALTRTERRHWIRLARQCGCAIEAVFFDTPFDECRRRNAARQRQVPAGVLERMVRRMTVPRVEEGFDRVTVIGEWTHPQVTHYCSVPDRSPGTEAEALGFPDGASSEPMK